MALKHAVIFDIDGTLLHSAREDELLYKQAVERVLGPVQFRRSLLDYSHVSDSGILLQILHDNGRAPDVKLIAAIKDQFLAAMKKYVTDFGPFREVSGAKRFIASLQRSAKHAAAIATGGWYHTADFKLASAGFDLNGVPLHSSDDALDRVEIMQMALRSIGDGCDTVTYYGDGPWDEVACRKLGWSFRAVGAALGGIESYEREFLP
jgi:FMN phosphatase YigB (HAD superfamily)